MFVRDQNYAPTAQVSKFVLDTWCKVLSFFMEWKCSSGYLVDHKKSISTSCGSLPYKSIESIFDTQEPYGQGKSKKQDCLEDLSTCTKLYENDTYDSSIPRVC